MEILKGEIKPGIFSFRQANTRLAGSCAASRWLNDLISLPGKIHINMSMARSLLFISMTKHPLTPLLKAESTPPPSQIAALLQVVINCPLKKPQRRRVQVKLPLLWPSRRQTAADMVQTSRRTRSKFALLPPALLNLRRNTYTSACLCWSERRRCCSPLSTN